MQQINVIHMGWYARVVPVTSGLGQVDNYRLFFR